VATAARRRREREQRRESILRAAREVFFRRGFHRATVDEVAEVAEVSKGTVYLYFESKETILAHLLLEGLNELVKRLERAFAPEEALAADVRIRRLARAYLSFFQEEPDYFRLLMALDRGRFQETVPEEVYQQVLTQSLRGLHWLVQAVQQGMDEGRFQVEDARQAAGVLWAALNGVLVLLGHPLRREILASELETLYEAALETVLRGWRHEVGGA